MMHAIGRLIAIILAVGLAVPGPAVSPASAGFSVIHRKVALVIGEGAYEHASPLANAAGDAYRIAAALTGAGFTVRRAIDASRKEIATTLAAFETDASSADLAVIYYAGHGVAVGNRAYLVPVEAEIRSPSDAALATIPLGDVLSASRPMSGNLVAFIDAMFAPIGDMPRSYQPAVEERLALLLAADAGGVAEDGRPGEGGPFANALVRALGEPGLDLARLASFMEGEVARTTSGRQRPRTLAPGRMMDLMLNAGPRPPLAPAPAPPGPAVGSPGLREARAAAPTAEALTRSRAASAPSLGAASASSLASSGPVYSSSRALVIGVDAYSDWPRLRNAVADARAVAGALRDLGFAVRLVENPDGDALEDALERFFIEDGDDPGARLLLWYAGHGETIAGEGYLVPRDAPLPEVGPAFRLASLSMRRFGEFMREARARHVLAVFDSCFAGTVFDATRSRTTAAISRATAEPVRQFVTSGDSDQEVSDDGTFRRLFVDAMTGIDPRADANGDNWLTGSELGLFLADRVTNYSEGRQTPRWGKLTAYGFDRGDFVFALDGAR